EKSDRDPGVGVSQPCDPSLDKGIEAGQRGSENGHAQLISGGSLRRLRGDHTAQRSRSLIEPGDIVAIEQFENCGFLLQPRGKAAVGLWVVANANAQAAGLLDVGVLIVADVSRG